MAVKPYRTAAVILAAALFGAGGFYLAAPAAAARLAELLLHGSPEKLIDYFQSLGDKAMWVSMGLLILISIFGVLPNLFILIANGMLFGIAAGTLISWVGECVGAALGFWLLRYLFGDYARRLLASGNWLQYLNRLNSGSGFKLMLTARAIPYMPSGLITALGAVSTMRFRDYIAATAIGKLPSVWLEVALGHDLAAYREHSGRLMLLAAASIAAYSFAVYCRRKEKPTR